MESQIRKQWVWIALLAIVLLTAAIRIRLLAVPLERDEGEYAYAGQLILQGIPPYAQVYNMKLPGIYAAYAAILYIFGQTASGIHAGLLVVNIAAILIFFFMVKKLFGPLVAITAAAAFAILAMGKYVLGMFGHATHFILPPALAGILLLINGIDRKRNLLVFLGAILLGTAFMMKQHGIAFVLFGLVYLLYRVVLQRPFSWKDAGSKIGLFIFGAAIPFAATCLILWWCGVFAKFWFWTFDYAKEYVSAVPFGIGMEILGNEMRQISSSAILIWLMAAIGLVALFMDGKFREHRVFTIGFLLFSFLSVCPGLYFRKHYFITLLPAVALFTGIGLNAVTQLACRSKHLAVSKIVPIFVVFAVFSYSLYQQRQFLFVMSPAAASRATYGLNPFVESPEIAKYIREHSNTSDTIAVLGSEPQIFFYAQRHSATGYIYMYPLMEGHPYAVKMQQEMIRQIEAARPRFLVFVSTPTSWLRREESDPSIFNWLEKYVPANYNSVGLIEILPDGKPVYHWGLHAENISQRTDFWLMVYERKTSQGASTKAQSR
jgi:hypothetical protein